MSTLTNNNRKIAIMKLNLRFLILTLRKNQLCANEAGIVTLINFIFPYSMFIKLALNTTLLEYRAIFVYCVFSNLVRDLAVSRNIQEEFF